MRKILTFLLAIVVVASLVGCASADAFLGTWTLTVSEPVPGMEGFEAELTMDLSISEDETFNLSIAIENMDEFGAYLTDMLDQEKQLLLEQLSITEEDLDATFQQTEGMTYEEYVATIIEDSYVLLETELAGETITGTWTLEGDSLVAISDSGAETFGDTFTVDGDMLIDSESNEWAKA